MAQSPFHVNDAATPSLGSDALHTASVAPLTGAETEHQIVATLHLHEERPVVSYATQKVGEVTFRRELRTQVVNVPIELKTEVLVIEYAKSLVAPAFLADRQVMINGQPIGIGQTIEIVLQEEQANVVKQVVVVEDINIHKQTQHEQHSVAVELAREVLVQAGNTELVREHHGDNSSKP